MNNVFIGLAIAGGIGLTFLLMKWQYSIARTLAEGYIAQQCPEAELLKVGIPPLRLWLRNRKGDKWAKLRHADGQEVWLRVRDTLWSGTKYDEFA